MKKEIIYLLAGSIVGVILATSFFTFLWDYNLKSDTKLVSKAAVTTSDTIPTLILPTTYFSRESLESANGTNKVYVRSDAKLEQAIYSGGYRSFPTTTITFTDYTNEYSLIPDIPTKQEWGAIIESSGQFRGTYIEQVAKYGDLAKRYNAEGRQIEVNEADVTGDGIKEYILDIKSLGQSHPPNEYQIIQGTNIIFKAGGELTTERHSIVPSKDGNGFTLSWSNEKYHPEGQSCCAIGHTSTRFVYEDNAFRPVYEQEELYFEVGN